MRRAIFLLALILTASQRSLAQPRWPADEPLSLAHDWIQIKSDEWLKGELIALYEDELLFDSVEFGPRTWDWKDVKQVRTAHRFAVGLLGGEVVVGKLVIAGETVRIEGDESREVTRDQILSITPSGWKPLGRLGGKVSAGLTAHQGNVDQIDANVSAEIEHRRVRDRIELDYLANYNSNQGSDTANNQRITSQWTHFITGRFFVKPAVLEWYRDPFQNLDARITAGAEAGYQIFDTRRTEWQVAAGLAYQQTQWAGVEAGEDAKPSTAALIGSTSFEQEWTQAIDFNFDYTFYLTKEIAGRYVHHVSTRLEVDLTDVLDLDVSLYWDRTQAPRAAPNGIVPDQDDFRMVIGLGIEF